MQFLFVFAFVEFAFGGGCLEDFKESQNGGSWGWCSPSECFEISTSVYGQRTCINQNECGVSICPESDGVSTCFSNNFGGTDQFGYLCATGDGCPLTKIDGNIKNCTYPTNLKLVTSTCDEIYSGSADCLSNSNCYWDQYGYCRDKSLAGSCSSLSNDDCLLVQVDGVAACVIDTEVGCRRKKCSDYNSVGNCPEGLVFPYCEWRVGLSPEEGVGACVPYGFPLGNCEAYNFSGACEADTTTFGDGCAWLKPYFGDPYCGPVRNTGCEYFITSGKCNVANNCFWNRGQCENLVSILSCDDLDSNNCGRPGILACVPEAGECRRKTCDDAYVDDVEWDTSACINDPSCRWIFAYSGVTPVLGKSAGTCVSSENMGGCASYKHPQQCMGIAGCLFVTKPGTGGVCVSESSVTDCAWMTDSSVCNKNDRHSQASCVWQSSVCAASPCGSLTAAAGCTSNTNCLWVKNKAGNHGLCVSSASLVLCEQYENRGQCDDSAKGCTWIVDYDENYERQERCVSLTSINSLECQALTNLTQCQNKAACMWSSLNSNDPAYAWLNSQFGGHCIYTCTNLEEEECAEKFQDCYSTNDGAWAFVSCESKELLQCSEYSNTDDYTCTHYYEQGRRCVYVIDTQVCRMVEVVSTCGAAAHSIECEDVVAQNCYWDYSSSQCLVRPVNCEDRDMNNCGNNECYYSSKISACREKTNTCADYENRYGCENDLIPETNERKCYWKEVYDNVGNLITTCKAIPSNCGGYDSEGSCASSPKCYVKNDGGSFSCLPVSPQCTATEMNDCSATGLCDVVYYDESDYTKFKCIRRPCLSYATNPGECQMFDDCASHSAYPYCSEIPDSTPLVSCDGGLSEQACIAKGEACEWKGTETGCSYSCGSRRSEWSCTSNGCAFILAAYTGNGKCVTKNSVACSVYKNKAQCDSSKDALGKACVFAKSLAAGASDTDFVCRPVSQTCAGASTDQECQKVVDPSVPISLDGKSCQWDYTASDCKHLNCSHIHNSVDCEGFDSCFYNSDPTWICDSFIRDNCDSVDAENCPKIMLTGGGKCHFSDDVCKTLDLSGLFCTDGGVDTCDHITPSSGDKCYWDGDSCEILPTVCNARSVSACTREHPTGCYVPSTGAPPCAEITSTCAGYTSKTDCEKYVLSSTDPSYSLCYWRTSGGGPGECVQSDSQLCTANNKDECVSSGWCLYDDLAKKCKHYGCGIYPEEICGLIYGCEYADSTCRSAGNEITKCDELSSSDCVSGSKLAQLNCMVDGTVCRQKVCTDINTRASCNEFVPAGGTGRCVWTKGAAAGNPERCVPLSSVSSCESFDESLTCNLLDTCIWNILDELTVCLNKSAILSCSSVSKTHCSDITNIACFLPEGTGKTCVEGKCTDISGTTSDKEDSCLAIPACSWIYSSSENTNSGSCVFRNAVQCSHYINAVQCNESLDAQEKQCVHASPYTAGASSPPVCKVLSLSCAEATSDKECGKVDDKVTPIDGCKWDVSNHKCRNFLCADFTTECPDSCLSAGPICSSYERGSCDLDDPLSCAKIILPGGKTCHYSGGECRALDNCNDGDSTNCNKILTSGNDRCYWDGDSCDILPTECQDRPEVACIREHEIGCYLSSSSQCREISSSCSGYLTEADCRILKSDITETAFKCFWDSGAASGSCVEASKSCASAITQPDCSSSGLCIYSGGTCQHKPCSTYFDTATCSFAGCEYSLESSSCGACSELDVNSCTSREGCVWNGDSGVCSKKKSSPEERKKSNAGAIAGAVVGSIVFLLVVVVGITVLVLYLKKLGPFKKGDTVEEGKGANEKNDVEMTTTNPISSKKRITSKK